jgi:hypothetical protein
VADAMIKAPAYAIMPIMKERIEPVGDDFWSERRELFTAQFPTYYTTPEKVWGRFHTSEDNMNPHDMK